MRGRFSLYPPLVVRKQLVGDAMVSTGVDSGDGNTVGDDCKSSKKKVNANDSVYALAA